MSIDDINLRKGNASTACTVFIDAKTHRILIIVQGASSAVAKKVLKLFPSVEVVSRDRGSAYKKAATEEGKAQVTDEFHLIQNLHQALKETLSIEVGQNLFVREGDGWVHPNEANSLSTSSQEQSQSLTLSNEDQEQRVILAGLTQRQAAKYKATIKILELTDSGVRTPVIARRLGLKRSTVSTYRKQAPETIEKVEARIDEYMHIQQTGQWKEFQKTVSPQASHSSKSIVEPYKETVLCMYGEGHSHRTIHAAIVKKGFEGSANAIYQFLIRFARENNLPYGRNARLIESKDQEEISRPSYISLERVSKKTIYQILLRKAAYIRDTWKQPVDDFKPSISENANVGKVKYKPPTTYYPDEISDNIFDTEPKMKNQTRTVPNLEELTKESPILEHLLQFLVAFYEVFFSKDVAKLDHFIDLYRNDPIEILASYAIELQKDYDGIINNFQYPDISNGPIEGTNTKLKLIRRRGYGRAGLELLNAIAVLGGNVIDIDNSVG